MFLRPNSQNKFRLALFPAFGAFLFINGFLSFGFAKENTTEPVKEKNQPAKVEPKKADEPLVNPSATVVFPAVDTKIDKNEILGHIHYLASKELEGRETGEPGQYKAAEYISKKFEEYGLIPFGDTKDGKQIWLNSFSVGRSNGMKKSTTLSLKHEETTTAFVGKKDFSIIPMNKKKSVANGGVAFAGYAAKDDSLGYDDFKGLDLTGKWALILRYEPQEFDPDSKFNGTENTKNAYFNTKIKNCISRKAVGVLIVDGPTGRENKKEKLFSSKGPMIGNFPMPVFHISRKTADAILASSGKTITDLQESIDKDLTNHSFVIDGVEINGVSELSFGGADTANVVGCLPGRDEKLKDEYVVIGAHYDHIGFGSSGSLLGRAGRGKLHPGADDNASGTAALLEIAQQLGSLPKEKRPLRSILFIAFSGEEKGLRGSRHFVSRPYIPLKSIVTMINMDMLGRSPGGGVKVAGLGTGSGFPELVEKHSPEELEIFPAAGGKAPSDNTSFYVKDIPVIFFNTGTHPDYHRPTDTWEKVNAPACASIARMAKNILIDIADNPERPKFKKTETRGSIGVTMDTKKYRTAKGYPVGKVLEDGPAAKVGIQSGDLITHINKAQLSDARGFIMGIMACAPGDKVQLVIKRREEILEKEVVMAEPPKRKRRKKKKTPNAKPSDKKEPAKSESKN